MRCLDHIGDRPSVDAKLSRLIWGLKVMRACGRVPISISDYGLLAGPDGAEVDEAGRQVLERLGWIWDDDQECYKILL